MVYNFLTSCTTIPVYRFNAFFLCFYQDRSFWRLPPKSTNLGRYPKDSRQNANVKPFVSIKNTDHPRVFFVTLRDITKNTELLWNYNDAEWEIQQQRQTLLFKWIAIHSFLFITMLFFPAQTEYSSFSADVRLKIFLWVFSDFSVWHSVYQLASFAV